jgi:hypothetical protein
MARLAGSSMKNLIAPGEAGHCFAQAQVHRFGGLRLAPHAITEPVAASLFGGRGSLPVEEENRTGVCARRYKEDRGYPGSFMPAPNPSFQRTAFGSR